MANKKLLVGGLIVAVLVLTAILMTGNRESEPAPIGPAKTGPAIPDGSGTEITDGAREIKKEETEEKIVITLPYAPSQPTTSIVPMGETMYHPKPRNPEGHPGIDFQWKLGKPIDILACHAGEVIFAERTPSHNKWDVHIKFGNYTIVYAELENIESNITPGAKVVLGQRIGEPGKFNGNHYNMHWELRSGSNRICPLSYFDPESRARIEKAWASTNAPEMKANAPEICSNDYKGRDK